MGAKLLTRHGGKASCQTKKLPWLFVIARRCDGLIAIGGGRYRRAPYNS
jgi:hypothetical protein